MTAPMAWGMKFNTHFCLAVHLSFKTTFRILMKFFMHGIVAGLHLVVGAFLAGQFVRREILDNRVYEVINDRFFGIGYGFLVPISSGSA
jgi:Kef-type K+ transport system membrane component KefB